MRTRLNAWANNSLLIVDGVTASSSPALHDTGLFMVVPPATLAVITGVNMGPVIVDLEPLDSAPPTPNPDDWEDIAELTLRRVPGVPVTVHGEMELPAPNAPDLATSSSPALRLRVSGNGRDTFRDLAVSEPTEHYLVQAWPANDVDGVVWSASTSATARNRRATRQPSGDHGAPGT